MGTSIPLVAGLVAGICFILSLGGLSQHETARRGNWLGISGMAIALVATIAAMLAGQFTMGGLILLMVAIGVGSFVGSTLAARVEMTSMPQLVAILHSFVGLAAVLVGISVYLTPHTPVVVEGSGEIVLTHEIIHLIEIFLGVFIGGLTFTGSIVAWGKLEGKINSTPLMLPGRHWLNLIMLIACGLLGIWFCMMTSIYLGLIPLIVVMLISFVIGVHMVMAIGGADMPVVVSMLNSYSGWAAAATGFMLGSDLLIVTGALVGSSGAILSYIMCRAMNRSFISVIAGGFGTTSGGGAADDSERLPHTATTAEETAQMLLDAKEVIVVPGYGMAVAQAQHPIREVTEILKARGTRTRFAIHPVAGRLPGHMNVLLAEARLPYDLVLEMDEINEDFQDTHVVLVIGANDIVNPGAQTDESSPIYGMPVLEVWKSTNVVVFKRSMGSGYSGVDNPLFYLENTDMLFGDAKQSVDDILKNLR